jgi:hypothetical protein
MAGDNISDLVADKNAKISVPPVCDCLAIGVI